MRELWCPKQFGSPPEWSAEIKQEIALEIAHVFFIDIVAYSKMAMDDQRTAIEKLNQIVQRKIISPRRRNQHARRVRYPYPPTAW